MNIKTIQKNNCENCRYYSQHFSKQNTEYRTVFCGHCLNRSNKNKRKINPLEVCELWENIAIKKEHRRKLIKETLESMSERLDEIALILKDDID